MQLIIAFVIILSVFNLKSEGTEIIDNESFPKSFLFGVATAAYQVEGAWNINGKTESIWDYYTHTFPEKILDGLNGDIACDSYNKIDIDVENLKKLKVDFYRFSISWPRILPTGFANEINADGVRYYNDLINALIKNNIKPVVTLYHWDLPKKFHDIGGWTNIKVAEYFAEYAKACFALFGDRVKLWITINEPYQICDFGYGTSVFAPFFNYSGVADYLCGHTIILAHANAYRIYEKEFKDKQKGKVGITAESSWFEPESNSKEDVDAAETIIQMHFGWFMNAIYSKEGDYPAIMRNRIDTISKSQGFHKSRLPYFTPTEIKHIQGTHDFLGLNHYTSFMVKPNANANIKIVSNVEDIGVRIYQDPKWEGTARKEFKVVPWGLRKLLNWIKNAYDNPEVIITENGYAGFINETTDDVPRVNYYNKYLSEVLKAIRLDGCNVTGYTAWSFMDNYEWSDGYTMRFGMYYVDFTDPDRSRKPKKSAFAYRNIIESRKINDTIDLNQLHA